MSTRIASLLGALMVVGALVLLMGTDVSLAHNGQPHRYALQTMAQDPNQTRTEAGLPMLAVDRQLTKEADHYADVLCRRGVLEHADDITGNGKYGWYGENIGRTTGSFETFERAFRESPGHYDNIVRPQFTHIGTGVCRRGVVWYVVYRFGG